MASERGVFAEEYRIWHTPAVGAYLFWRFATIYVANSRDGALPSCIHFFLLAGILRQVKVVNSYIYRRRSLLGVIKAAIDNGDADLIDGIHARVRDSMPYTTAALDIAVAAGMLEWDFDAAALRPLKVETVLKSGGYRNSKYFTRMVSIVESLGRLFAAVPSVNDVAKLLKVRL